MVEVIVRHGLERLVEERLERLEGLRAPGRRSSRCRGSGRRKLPSAPPRWRSSWATTLAAIRGVADHAGRRTAGGRRGCRRSRRRRSLAIRLYWIWSSASRATWLVVTRSSQSRTSGPVERQPAHVADVEQPDPLADRLVLLDDRRVLDGHRPAAELDEPAAVGLVPVVQRASGGAVAVDDTRASTMRLR